MVFKLLRRNKGIKDEVFNDIYPKGIRKLSDMHWSPVNIAYSAAEYLVKKSGTKVLDIGSGAGKFCLIGATLTDGHFTGVEQRPNLIKISKTLSKQHHIQNVNFVHANIMAIDFQHFEAFYYFNPFYENIDPANCIDHTIEHSVHHYETYSTYVVDQLAQMPIGTRLATVCTALNRIPGSFQLADSLYNGKLKLWEKVELVK